MINLNFQVFKKKISYEKYLYIKYIKIYFNLI